MYIYDEIDQRIVDERVEQFRDQTQRYLDGTLDEDEFRALRLMNGLYIQRQAPMLRVAIPYGLLSSNQLRGLAEVSRRYDRGYGHFTTRTNIQFNWPELEAVPDLLADLAKVQLHAIQTSGNCIRNTTTDHFAGILPEEVEDPRPWCELIRQWSTLHPEFAYLPRKFKIAVVGRSEDRAATRVHDIGLRLTRNADEQLGFEVFVGGGLGRTPVIGKSIRAFLPAEQILAYLDAILRVYNLKGRRDNKYKARIKILVDALGAEQFAQEVEQEWRSLNDPELIVPESEINRLRSFFNRKTYDERAASDLSLDQHLDQDSEFKHWYRQNTHPHKVPGYRAVTLSLKPHLGAPGDITALQMERVADLADTYALSEIRSTHEQNLLFADVRQQDLYTLWQALVELNLARANIGTLTDMIVCPGFDFCSLANARTLNIADDINRVFDDLDYLHDLGEIRLNMSGCINACGHHHVGHIGILGVDKKGEDWYQITIGGSSREDVSLGKVIGKSVAADQVTEVLKRLLETYVDLRVPGERFIDTVRREGVQPFKESVYATA